MERPDFQGHSKKCLSEIIVWHITTSVTCKKWDSFWMNAIFAKNNDIKCNIESFSKRKINVPRS